MVITFFANCRIWVADKPCPRKSVASSALNFLKSNRKSAADLINTNFIVINNWSSDMTLLNLLGMLILPIILSLKFSRSPFYDVSMYRWVRKARVNSRKLVDFAISFHLHGSINNLDSQTSSARLHTGSICLLAILKQPSTSINWSLFFNNHWLIIQNERRISSCGIQLLHFAQIFAFAGPLAISIMG